MIPAVINLMGSLNKKSDFQRVISQSDDEENTLIDCSCFGGAAGVWRRSASMAAWAAWRSPMSASPGRSRCPGGVSRRRWSSRWGRRRGNCLRTERPSPAPPSSRPSWARRPSWPCSSTSASCRRRCPSAEVSGAPERHLDLKAGFFLQLQQCGNWCNWCTKAAEVVLNWSKS